MIRRQARLRREFLYRKAVEERNRAKEDKKQRLKTALQENKMLDGDLRRDALDLAASAKFDDAGPQVAADQMAAPEAASAQDDEYRWMGVEDPKVMVTTARDPSARLKKFVKEVRLLIPNSQRLNRGNYELKQLMSACRANGVTDLVLLHEHRGVPDGLIISHLPFGPTAHFTLTDVVMRHDLPKEEVGAHVSEAYPHLIFHNLESQLGKRTMTILKALFPVPKEDSKRVMTFANHDDFISFRHHVYKRSTVSKNDVELVEVGPRFQLRLFSIKLGTIDNEAAAQTEFALKPFMRTSSKRRFLSDKDGFVVE